MDRISTSERLNHDRRRFFGAAALTAAAGELGLLTPAVAQPAKKIIKLGTNVSFEPLKHINAGVLNVAYVEAGPADGPPVILLHGWPYDIHSFVDVTPMLASAGYRVLVPYLRGYGADALSFQRDLPQRSAFGAGGRCHRFHGCAQDREGDPRRLRLGRAVGRYCCGALAGARQGARRRQRIPDRQPGSRQNAVAAQGRVRVVVPVLFRHGARPHRLRE